LAELLAQHADELAKAETLILDLRGNPGGNLPLQTLFEPYYRAASTHTRRATAWQPVTLSSPVQIAYFSSKTPPMMPPREWQAFLKQLSARSGEIVAMPIAEPTPHKSTGSGPKWFVVFVDNGTRGEAEDFVLRSWTSGKVRIVGESTAGGADYLGQNELKLPCGGLTLRYPTYAHSRDIEANGVNARGIQPDIYISPEEDDPIAAILQRLPGTTADRK
jgi:C-terminal processing protease CtpA/Prc